MGDNEVGSLQELGANATNLAAAVTALGGGNALLLVHEAHDTTGSLDTAETR